jgi:hypothetical protein
MTNQHVSLLELIQQNISNSKELEKLYQSQPQQFKSTFLSNLNELPNAPLIEFWKERLSFTIEKKAVFAKDILIVLLSLIGISGIIAKLPVWLDLAPEFYFQRNIGFILFPAVTAFFLFKNKSSNTTIGAYSLIVILIAAFINLLPYNQQSQTLMIACMYLPFFLWTISGAASAGSSFRKHENWISYLQMNGDWLVMSAILSITGGIVTGITVGLFELIQVKLEIILSKHILYWALPAIPITALILVNQFPNLINKVAPTIANIFSPLVLVVLIAYLTTLLLTGKNPYNNRDFLILFNVMLIGVMALILFASGNKQESTSKFVHINLTALSWVAIAINLIAVSAIVFRIVQGGFTPNRVTVLGSNILILVHLVWVSLALTKQIKGKKDTAAIQNAIALFIPAYMIWAAINIFIFPFLFGGK